MPLLKEQKELVRSLRARGFTYKEINDTLGFHVARSSLSYICRCVSLPSEYQDKVKDLNRKHLESVRPLALHSNKRKRERYIREIEEKNKYVCKGFTTNVAKIALAMLYLGEGGKWPSHRGLYLGSSSDDIIRLYIKLLQYCYEVPLSKMRARIQYRADQDILELENHWVKVTGLSKEQLYKTQPDKRTLGKPTKRGAYRGVCVIMCGSTEIQLELAIIARLLSKHMGH